MTNWTTGILQFIATSKVMDMREIEDVDLVILN